MGTDIAESLPFIGDWALRFLLISLDVTPLRMLTGMSWLIRYRRMLGLFAFFYALVHFAIYLWIDQGFLWSEIIADILKRPYITLGFAAFLILVPLAVTSTTFRYSFAVAVGASAFEQGEMAATLRAAGKIVVGGTPYTDRLEDDRTFGQQELKKHGVSIIPFQEFTDFDSAIAYVRSHPAPYVIKPSGEAQNIKRLLFVGQEDDGRDVMHVLESYKAVYADTVKVFQLQRRMRGVAWVVL